MYTVDSSAVQFAKEENYLIHFSDRNDLIQFDLICCCQLIEH